VSQYLSDLFTSSSETAAVLSQGKTITIPATMANIADSMTNVIRQSPNATTVLGQKQLPEVFIHVTWPWISLPILTVLLTLALLIIYVLTTRGEGKKL
jgi:hypothetical protein